MNKRLSNSKFRFLAIIGALLATNIPTRNGISQSNNPTNYPEGSSPDSVFWGTSCGPAWQTTANPPSMAIGTPDGSGCYVIRTCTYYILWIPISTSISHDKIPCPSGVY